MHLSLLVLQPSLYLTLEWKYRYLLISVYPYFNFEMEMLSTLHYRSVYHYCLQRYQQLKQQWEMNCEQAELLEMKLQQSAYHKHEEELLALKKTIGDEYVLNLLTEN